MVSDASTCLPVARPMRPQTPGPIVGSGVTHGQHDGHIAFLYNHKWILELRSVIEIRGDYLNVLGSLIGFPASGSGFRVKDDKSQSHDSRKVIHWEDFWDESQSQESSTDN